MKIEILTFGAHPEYRDYFLYIGWVNIGLINNRSLFSIHLLEGCLSVEFLFIEILTSLIVNKK